MSAHEEWLFRDYLLGNAGCHFDYDPASDGPEVGIINTILGAAYLDFKAEERLRDGGV